MRDIAAKLGNSSARLLTRNSETVRDKIFGSAGADASPATLSARKP
jgi:hypothetical protein